MEELVDQVVQRTGISRDQARKAVDVIVNQLEKRLPAPIASQVRSHLGGDGAEDAGAGAGDTGTGAGNAAKKLGDMLGG